MTRPNALPDAGASRRLVARELQHAYRGGRQVLRGLDLTVEPGELVGLLGPNGSGKSTALALIGGLARLQAGAVTWHDADGVPHPVDSYGYRARMGMVFQSPSLDRALTARQNLTLAARMQGIPAKAAAERATALLAWADLADRADDAVKAYSGGMARRLEFARAIVHTPELLLLDEPTTGLDAQSFDRAWALVDNLRRAHGTSVLLATHRPEEAARCDRLVIIDDGRAVRVDTPERLVSEIADDLVVIEADAPDALAATIRERFGLAARVEAGASRVLVECARGHEVIVRLVEGLPAGRVDAISLRRPTLGDVFLKLTGAALDADLASREAA
ncbi:MAG: ABC transporter ATP-binding protein [Deltaproteobacteria bacterium HGW-Deltaproteobacteria-14]|jgi:ABC-2 type transport system ATP-binding protein|nr:MAG: ABC transporter ATP-binding protein [Deltaproteobacteria bacterium HGW-Deltaproteobacteria-14]